MFFLIISLEKLQGKGLIARGIMDDGTMDKNFAKGLWIGGVKYSTVN